MHNIKSKGKCLLAHHKYNYIRSIARGYSKRLYFMVSLDEIKTLIVIQSFVNFASVIKCRCFKCLLV